MKAGTPAHDKNERPTGARLPAFDVEHALNMYAYSFCNLPAAAIYDKDALASLGEVLDTCHIYLIGYTPKVELVDTRQEGSVLLMTFLVLKQQHTVKLPLPPGYSLQHENDLWYIRDPQGDRVGPDDNQMLNLLSDQTGSVKFEVKYVGQAFGKDGSRTAVDRLLKHETLQKIAIKGVPEGYQLSLLLLAIQPQNQTITLLNPRARDATQGEARISNGIDKLYATTEEERISLYEAALIRYFYPEFNKEFKDSFPSTNLKILQDCYDKDFSAVVAEICFDELPFRLWSGAVPPKNYHIARHNLHESEDRNMFFGR